MIEEPILVDTGGLIALYNQKDPAHDAGVELTYKDQGVDLADAALVHLGNRERITTVFATDLRHFRVYRLKNGQQSRILPADV